jgi:transposase
VLGKKGTEGNVKVIAKQERAICPRCSHDCHQLHDCRERAKRGVSLRGYQVNLIILKRRFRCPICGKPFTEPDHACGPRRRTTRRLRDLIGKQAFSRDSACHESLSQGRFQLGAPERGQILLHRQMVGIIKCLNNLFNSRQCK